MIASDLITLCKHHHHNHDSGTDSKKDEETKGKDDGKARHFSDAIKHGLEATAAFGGAAAAAAAGQPVLGALSAAVGALAANEAINDLRNTSDNKNNDDDSNDKRSE